MEKNHSNAPIKKTNTTSKPTNKPYRKVLLNSSTKKISLLKWRNFKVRLTAVNGPNVMYRVSAVLKTGAAPKIVSRKIVSPEW